MKITTSIAVNSMRTSYNKLNIISNNIANSNTNGFKRRYAAVENGTLYSANNRLGIGIENQVLPSNIGANISSVNIDFAQGGLIYSARAEDFAIEGNGFFGVTDPETGEIHLTRNGEFSKFGDGIYRDRFGRELHVNPSISPTSDFNFVLYGVDQDKLTGVGFNFYKINEDAIVTDNVNNPESFGNVIQHSLETSNIDLAKEFVSLMEVQSIHSMSSKIFQVDDEVVESLNTLER